MEMKQRVSAFVYWAPRVLSIMFIAFLALFSLDVITPESSLKEIIVGLIMHNIPVFIMIIVLVIAWKHEIVGSSPKCAVKTVLLYWSMFV
jgi:hypothetical protein